MYGVTQYPWDEWHNVDVGVTTDFAQVQVHHGTPEECHVEYEVETGEPRHFCQIGQMEDFSGSDWFKDVFGEDTPPGLYRVRGRLERDYWGEYDTDWQVVRLHGPADERDFEGEFS